MKVLVSGSTGQVGQEIQYLSENYPEWEFTFLDRENFDLGDAESIKNQLLKTEADWFINTAAYTAVDKAEMDKETALKVNSEALSHIAAFLPISTKIIHLSTDYVYHTHPGRPLIETDESQALSVYALTKKSGEDNLLKYRPDAIIIRTSWVYSSYGKNFVKTMKRLGNDKDELSIVSDQNGTPTYARDLAEALLQIIYKVKPKTEVQNCSGIYNYSNLGQTNWAEFARTIFKIENISCQVKEISTEAFNAAAPRPLWSVMSKEKIRSCFDLKIRPWESALEDCLEILRDDTTDKV